MSRNLSMAETAAEVGLSYDRFRKVWRDLVASIGLPAPHLGRKWDADALEGWKQDRAGRQLETPRGREAIASDAVARRARQALHDLRS